MKPDKTIDANAFASAFRENMAAAHAEADAPPPADVKQKVVALMTAHAPAADPEPQGLLGIDLGDFCTNWLKIRAGIYRALWFAQFFMGASLIAQIRSFVVTFEKMAFPLVCPAPPPAE